MHKSFATTLFCILIAFLTLTARAELPQLRGVNLAGAEFNHQSFWPTSQEIDYFQSKGMNVFRVPFLWERLQPTLNDNFNTDQQRNIDRLVTEVTGKGIRVILDPHNYARYNGKLIGSTEVPNSAFADFWSRLANRYKNNSLVIFGLMNEPHSMRTEQWRASANIAIQAIRDTGAKNLILVPGNAWTGAHSWAQDWYGTPNAEEMLKISDPKSNFAFEFHQYFDQDFSGTSPNCRSDAGAKQLISATNWLRQNGFSGILGEFAGANNPNCQKAVISALEHLQSNADVWLGWTWWAAGPAWSDYMFSLEPTNNFTTDSPQMAWLMPFLNSINFSDGFEANTAVRN